MVKVKEQGFQKETEKVIEKGILQRISGPVVTATGISARMYDLVKVGNLGLLGEVIKIEKEKTIIQVYEDTKGLKPGERVVNTGMPLSVELGPGLLKSIYDGIQRPLPELKKMQGDFIKRGAAAEALDLKKKWSFNAVAKKGNKVSEGNILGEVQETATIKHRILVPFGVKGKIKEIKSGSFRVRDTICVLEDGTKITMSHTWPVRKPKPVSRKLKPDVPLVTGQRILDTLFPIAKGGTAAIPGPFGSGKTVCQHQLAKWVDAEIIIFIGCGERGNEMTEVLEEFPNLIDPKSGKPLMERTVLIVNTSNMPVAAREACVYTGMTIAEYYRDMGYDVALMADSTSRWAEAMREISSRLEEMPGEEGYPAYLAAKLSAFYERAGRVVCSGSGQKERLGSITAVGAVSPPGGDFSEPVTQNTLRVTKVFWALDARLANRRHFPSINWLNSYSLYLKSLKAWFAENVAPEHGIFVEKAATLLQKEAQLQEIVQLVGSDALPEKDRLILDIAKMLREGFLQQNAYHEVDTYCSLRKQFGMVKCILDFYDMAMLALEEGVPIDDILLIDSKPEIMHLRFVKEQDFQKEIEKVTKKIGEDFKKLGGMKKPMGVAEK